MEEEVYIEYYLEERSFNKYKDVEAIAEYLKRRHRAWRNWTQENTMAMYEAWLMTSLGKLTLN